MFWEVERGECPTWDWVLSESSAWRVNSNCSLSFDSNSLNCKCLSQSFIFRDLWFKLPAVLTMASGCWESRFLSLKSSQQSVLLKAEPSLQTLLGSLRWSIRCWESSGHYLSRAPYMVPAWSVPSCGFHLLSSLGFGLSYPLNLLFWNPSWLQVYDSDLFLCLQLPKLKSFY